MQKTYLLIFYSSLLRSFSTVVSNFVFLLLWKSLLTRVRLWWCLGLVFYVSIKNIWKAFSATFDHTRSGKRQKSLIGSEVKVLGKESLTPNHPAWYNLDYISRSLAKYLLYLFKKSVVYFHFSDKVYTSKRFLSLSFRLNSALFEGTFLVRLRVHQVARRACGFFPFNGILLGSLAWTIKYLASSTTVMLALSAMLFHSGVFFTVKLCRIIFSVHESF